MTEHLSKDQALIGTLTEIVLANLENGNFGVKELAKKSGISENSLNRRLRSISNKTINQFIRETRLQKALDMFQNGELTVAEVSYQVGFSSPAYFTKCFHDFFGYSPGAVKKGSSDKATGQESTLVKSKREKNISARILMFISYVILIIAFSGYVAYIIYARIVSRSVATSSKIQEKSIAVLPFKNLSNSIENQYFIDGMMEEILMDLSKIHNLRVVSRTSVEQFRETSLTVSEIADKIDVNYILEGSGQKNGNIFRLRVQLIEAPKDTHIWAESFEQEIQETQNIFTIQSQIAQKIASELKINITPEEIQLIEKIPTKNLTAYDFLLRGNAELVKYWSNTIDINNRQALDRAGELYKKALVYDSTYAAVYLGLAQVYLSKHGNDSFLSVNYLDSMLVLIDLALTYDNHLARARVSRGFFYYYTGQGERSIKEFEQTIKYDPNSGEAYKSLSYLYAEDKDDADFVKALEYAYKALSLFSGIERVSFIRNMGMFYLLVAGFPDIAKDYFQEAFRLDGNIDVYNQNLADLEIASGNKEKALELIRQTYERDSNKVESILWLGYINYLTNQYKGSLFYLRKVENSLEALSPFNFTGPISFNEIAYVYLMNGYEKEADKWFDKQKKFSEVSIKFGRRSGISGSDYYELAALYAFQGDRKKAFENLREFAKIRICPLSTLANIKSNPFFNNIRNEPEFQKIVSNLEDKYQKEHERVRIWLDEKGKLYSKYAKN